MLINNMIENRTPYLGKMVLKFERHPYYTSSQDGKLNKVHLNLGFTKLVSRMEPKQVMEGYSNIDPKKIKLIEKYTGGVIGTHTFGKDDEHTLENSFLTKDGKYIGDINNAWWYYINKFYVCEEYPHGVAIKLKSYEPTIVLTNSIGDEYENFVTEQIENDNVEGFHGYSHRGGSTFKIGDRLFDADYMPIVDDYDRKEFEGYWKEYAKSYSRADGFDKKSIYGDGIKAVIPFNRRGKQVIEDWTQARQAAINMSKDLS
jgi:hypothetical protein